MSEAIVAGLVVGSLMVTVASLGGAMTANTTPSRGIVICFCVAVLGLASMGVAAILTR